MGMKAVTFEDLINKNIELEAKNIALELALAQSKKNEKTLSTGLEELKKLHKETLIQVEKLKCSNTILLFKQFVSKQDKIFSKCSIGEAISNSDYDGEILPSPTQGEQDDAFKSSDEKLQEKPNKPKKANLQRRGERHKIKPFKHDLKNGQKLSDIYPVKETVIVDTTEALAEITAKAGKGAKIIQVGENCVEVLTCEKYTKLFCKRYILKKFAVSGKPELGVTQVAAPPRLLPKIPCSEQLLSTFIFDKFNYRLPYAAQEKMWLSAGVNLSRKLLSDWQLKAMEHIVPLYELIGKELNKSDVLQMDETTVSIDDSKNAVSYVWIKLLADADKAGCYYRLGPNRSKKVLLDLLLGFLGYLQSDGYTCYDSLDRDNVGIKMVPCAAHLRRALVDATNLNEGHLKNANDIISLFDKLFDIERKCYDEYQKHKSKEIFLEKRKALAIPVINEIISLLNNPAILENGKLVINDKYDNAIAYISKFIDKLPRYLDKFELTPSNNAAERSNVRLKRGLDSWLKFGSERGCRSAMVILTLLRSAELNHIDPQKYLGYVLTNAPFIIYSPGYDASNLELWSKLLPWNVKDLDTI